MCDCQNSLFADLQNRNTQLWKKKSHFMEMAKIVRELNQKNSSNKIKCINNKGKLVDKPYYFLKNQYLCSKNKHIDLENLALKRVYQDQQFGLEVSTNHQNFQIFGKKEIIDDWFNYIKIYAIQSDFKTNYDIIEETGEGAYAKVYKVYNKRKGQIYAAKVFKKKNIQNQLGICKELNILRQLVHQNVIRFHEVYENKKYLYVIIDYLAGGQLLDAIVTSELYSEQVVKELIQNLLNTLYYIHSNNILHRDIKPENLLLRCSKNITDIVISDFGLSDEYHINGDYMFQQCGTIGYMAPEILRNQNYDFKVDIFSVGVILFMLLTDSNPFQGEKTEEILKNNCFCQINLDKLKNQSISPNAHDFLLQLLQDNPTKRPTAQQALQHDWFVLPKMETQTQCQFSLKNIPKFKTKKRPKYWIVQQSPYKNNFNSSLSLSGSSKSNNGSDCLSIQDDVLEYNSMEETQPITQLKFRSQEEKVDQLYEDENLDDMCDDNFYENQQSPSSLVKIYHLSVKEIKKLKEKKEFFKN